MKSRLLVDMDVAQKVHRVARSLRRTINEVVNLAMDDLEESVNKIIEGDVVHQLVKRAGRGKARSKKKKA